jgi:hypothetical protein
MTGAPVRIKLALSDGVCKASREMLVHVECKQYWNGVPKARRRGLALTFHSITDVLEAYLRVENILYSRVDVVRSVAQSHIACRRHRAKKRPKYRLHIQALRLSELV